jgi:hypothetical protein
MNKEKALLLFKKLKNKNTVKKIIEYTKSNSNSNSNSNTDYLEDFNFDNENEFYEVVDSLLTDNNCDYVKQFLIIHKDIVKKDPTKLYESLVNDEEYNSCNYDILKWCIEKKWYYNKKTLIIILDSYDSNFIELAIENCDKFKKNLIELLIRHSICYHLNNSEKWYDIVELLKKALKNGCEITWEACLASIDEDSWRCLDFCITKSDFEQEYKELKEYAKEQDGEIAINYLYERFPESEK